MLLGSFTGVELSEEGVIVPPPLRAGLEQGFVVTRGLDGCVAVFPLSEWDTVLQRMERGTSFLLGAARVFQRHLYGGASAGSLSSEGRMMVPGHLRRYARLGDEVVIVGVGARLEIWNSERWNEEESSIEKQAEAVSEALSQCGV